VVIVVFTWIFLAIIVGVAANTRGRNPAGWAVLAFVVSPLLAGLLLLALPNVYNPHAIDENTLHRNVQSNPPAKVGSGAFWLGGSIVALMMLGIIAFEHWADNQKTVSIAAPVSPVVSGHDASLLSLSPAGLILKIKISKRLAAGVADDETGARFFDRPGRWKTARGGVGHSRRQ
jgi:hypothetical protein